MSTPRSGTRSLVAKDAMRWGISRPPGKPFSLLFPFDQACCYQRQPASILFDAVRPYHPQTAVMWRTPLHGLYFFVIYGNRGFLPPNIQLQARRQGTTSYARDTLVATCFIIIVAWDPSVHPQCAGRKLAPRHLSSWRRNLPKLLDMILIINIMIVT